ncbi:MAG: sugar phosphate isomerase/epimerase [Armatimonadetes bacterium]|nr:sugar phosphate isomerase/epimerase [Armatimonadota bacterium]
MYVSVRDAHLPGPFGSIHAGLRAMGIEHVELNYDRDKTVPSLDSKDGGRESLANPTAIEHYRYKADGYRVKPCSLLLANNFGAQDLQGELDYVISALRAAAQMEIKAIRIDAYLSTQDQWPLEKRAQHFADCMKKILDATSSLDVTMGIENHGHKGNEQEFLDAVLDAVNSDRVGMTLDTGNFYWYGYPLKRVHEIIKHFAVRTKHTHMKTINFPADKRNIQREVGWGYGEYCSSLREGDIDIPYVVKELKNAGYTGDLCVENESLGRYDKEKQKAILIDDAAYLAQSLKSA